MFAKKGTSPVTKNAGQNSSGTTYMHVHGRGLCPSSSQSFRPLFTFLSFAVCLLTGQYRAHWCLFPFPEQQRGRVAPCSGTGEHDLQGTCASYTMGLSFSGLLLIIVQQLMCLKEGIDFEITPAPFLPCVSLGAWQKGSCWCSGEKRSVMDWKSVYFTLKSSSTCFWVV